MESMWRAKFVIALALSSLLLSGCTDPLRSNLEAENASPAGAKSTGDFEPRLSSSFDEAWPTKVSRDALIETALFRLFTDLDSIRDPNCSLGYQAFFGDPMLEEHHYLLKEIAEGMLSSYCDYMTDEIQVVAGNYEFVKQTVKEQGFAADKFGGVCGYDLQQDYAMACVWHELAWVGISLGSKREGVPFVEERRLTIAAHEIFHIVHEQIDPFSSASKSTCDRGEPTTETGGDRCFRPTWFVEGAGEFFGRAMTQYLGLQNYATFVPNDRSGFFMDPDYLSDLGVQSVVGNVAAGVEAYYSGAIATEYILANIGLIAYLDIWEQMGSGKSFFEAFEASAGIDIPTFYDKFRDLHLNLYETAGYCESSVGCSDWTRSEQLTAIPGLTGFLNHTGSGSRLVQNSSQGQGSDPSNCMEAYWWTACMTVQFQLPEEAENSDHGYPTEYGRIPKLDICAEYQSLGWEIPGWAASFEARADTGAQSAFVSTQHYAVMSHLDTNLDGVVCSVEIPD